MAVATASDRLAVQHQKDVAGVAGGVASAVIQTAMGADPAAISTWFFSALDGLMARIQAGYALNRRSAMGYLPQHGALNGVTVSAVPGSLDIGSSRARLNITGPVAFKRAIGAGFDEQQALRSMATQMSGVADELVRNGDRDVIVQTIRQGRGLVAYRRRLAGKSCGFCAMLASRGAVYSAETVNFRTHAHCRCYPAPVYRHEREPLEVQRLQRQWRRVTAGKSGKDAQRAWRKHWEQKATPAARAREGIRELVPAPVAATSPVDPALKLTVAQLKQIAKDANVPLYGATRKADIVRALRDRESVYVIKIPGLPEWKPPRVVPGADIKAPPLGVPAKEPVLSGGALNNWADHFKYDREYKRFEFVDANGNTPPEGIRVHNLRANIQGGFQSGFNEYMVHDGTAFSFDGVAYLIEHRADQFGSPWVSRTLADLRRAHEELPAAKLANKSYAALGGDNPADDYWRKKFNNPDHTSAAMAGNGNVTLWGFRAPYSEVSFNTLRHETGHNFDDLIGRAAKGSESPTWQAAAKSDVKASVKVKDLSDEKGFGGFGKIEPDRGFPEGVSKYGRSSAQEDFAESVELYQRGVIAQGRLAAGADKGPIWFRDLYPARAKILDDLFPDLAQAQKAEIAAARAPKPALKPSDRFTARAKMGQQALDATPFMDDIAEIMRRAGVPEWKVLEAQLELRRYKGSTFAPTNRLLRGQPLGDVATYEAKRALEGLDPAFEHSRLASDIVVYRGDKVSLAESRFAEGQEFMLPPGASIEGDLTGAEWVARTFESTTVNAEMAERFSVDARGAGQRTVMRIRAPKDTSAISLNRKAESIDPENKSEAEIVLGRGLRYRVVKDYGVDAKGVRRLDIEVVGSARPKGKPGDLSGLKVTELRALAKERGITGYSKLTKPQLLERLGGKAEVKVAAKAPETAFEAKISRAAKGQDALDAAGGRVQIVNRKPNGDLAEVTWGLDRERALESYRADSRSINDFLRSGTASPGVEERIRLIDGALGQSPSSRDAELWRGVQAFEDNMSARLAAGEDLVGVEWTDKAFTSTTARRRFAETEGNGPTYGGKPGVVMRILVPKGTGSVQLSSATYEAEILLPRGLRFRVVKDYGFEPPRQAGVGLGFRRIDVEIVPKSAKVLSAEKDLVTLARERQAAIDYTRARAELISEVEEWLNNQASLETMAIQLRRDATRFGVDPTHKDVAALFKAIDAKDKTKIVKAIEAIGKKQGVARIERAGEVVKFDPKLHAKVGAKGGPGDLKPGQQVYVVRPGYTFDRNGELIRLHKATVEEASAQEIASASINQILSQVTRRRRLAGGAMSDIDQLTLRNGDKYIYKKLRHVDNLSIQHQGDAEELGALMAQAVGLRAPTIYRANADELYMTFMDGELSMDAVGRSMRAMQGADGARMRLLDYLIENGDRNDGNWLIGERNQIQVIDHAMAFSQEGMVPSMPRDIDLSPADIDTLRSRIRALRSQFEHLNRLNWWQSTMSRLDALAKNAKGTKRIIE